MGERSLKVEIVQRKHKRFDIGANLETLHASVLDSDADLLVFPEMFLTGYTLGDEVYNLAISTDSDHFDGICGLAKEAGKHIVFGFPEKSNDIHGQLHNSAAVVGPGGLKGVYRKMHFVNFGPFEEWGYFTPGKDLITFDVGEWRFGLIICYDIFFPELVKYYALSGVDGVICISASPSVTRPYFETVMEARSVENTIYLIYSNLVGFDSRMDFWGGGAIIGPRGGLISKGKYFEEDRVEAIMEMEDISLARKWRPTLRDTRSDLLKALSSVGELKGGVGKRRK